MMMHIDVSSVLRQTLSCELYSNLVTRPTGAIVINKSVAARLGIDQNTPIEQRVQAFKGLKFAVSTPAPAGPLKSSVKTVVQPAGAPGAAASAGRETAVAAAPATARADSRERRARGTRRPCLTEDALIGTSLRERGGAMSAQSGGCGLTVPLSTNEVKA